jgi:hypothetical protein
MQGTDQKASRYRPDNDSENDDFASAPRGQRRARAQDRVRAHRLIGQVNRDEPSEQSDHGTDKHPTDNRGVATDRNRPGRAVDDAPLCVWLVDGDRFPAPGTEPGTLRELRSTLGAVIHATKRPASRLQGQASAETLAFTGSRVTR